MGTVNATDFERAGSSCDVPGQTVLPGMADELGYEAIVLKPFQERFCWEFVLRGDNAMRAYKVVKPGVKDSTARVEASKLLTNPDVQQRISQIRLELKRRYTVTADDLIQYHSKVLKIDRSEYMGDNGKPKAVADIDSEALSILEFDCERDPKGNVHVMFKVPTRHQSAVELARIQGLHKDGVILGGKLGMEHSGTVSAEDDAKKMDALRASFGMSMGSQDGDGSTAHSPA